MFRWLLFLGLAFLCCPVTPAWGQNSEKDIVFGHYQRGEASYRKGAILEAIEHYEKAVALAPRVLGEAHADTANIMNNLAKFYLDAGMLTKSEALTKKVTEMRARNDQKDTFPDAVSFNNLGEAYRRMGLFAEAERAYGQSLRIKEKMLRPPHISLVFSLNNLGLLDRDSGRLPESEQAFRKALAMLDELPNKDRDWKSFKGIVIDNLAQTLMHAGRYEKAEDLLKEALTLLEEARGKDHPDVAIVLNSFAWLYQQTGKHDRVEGLYKRCLDIQIRHLGEENANVAMTMNNLAVHYQLRREFRAAKELLERSLRIRRKVLPADHTDIAMGLNDLGVLLSDMGENKEAESFLLAGLKTGEAARQANQTGFLVQLNNLGRHYALVRDETKSLDYFDRARRGSYEFAARQLPYLTPREQRQVSNNILRRDYEIALTAALSQPAAAERSALWVLHGKGVEQSATTQAIQLSRESGNPKARDTVAELERIRRVLAHRSMASSAKEDGEELNSLQKREESLNRALREAVGIDYRIQPFIELTDFRKRIPAGAVVIEFARFRRWDFKTDRFSNETVYAAWLIPAAGDGEVRQIVLGDAEKIDAVITAARRAIEDSPTRLKKNEEAKVETETRELLAAVAKLVYDPLRPHLGRAKQLILAPDGDLWLLPWSALPTGKDRYLIEDYTLRFVVSGRDLVDVPLATKLEPSVPLILADPDYDLGPAQVAVAARDLLRGLPIPADQPRLVGLRCPGKIGNWNVSFEFAGSGKVIIRDEDNGGSVAGEAAWEFDGKQLTMHTKIAEFTGTIKANTVSGERTKRNDDGTLARDRWEFRLPGVARGSDSLASSLESSRIPKASRLPGTVPESRQAFAKLKLLTGKEPKLYQQADASEAVVKATKSPRVLLLATHGFFLKKQEIDVSDEKFGRMIEGRPTPQRTKDGADIENPLLRCGLLLAGANKRAEAKEGEDDGILTGLEIVGLDLRGTQLVILSACETGVGDVHTGEGVAGLRQAFQLAGAENVLATLWQINDEATVRLMNTFYDELAKGTDRAESLTRAQRQFLKERRDRFGAAHPFYWASFTMTGK